MTTQSFHLGTLLTITDGKLISPDGVAGIYEIVNFVTGQQHLTHQLPRAADVIKPWLLQQHPWLADIAVPEELGTELDIMLWLAEEGATRGLRHDVEAMPFGIYVGREPLTELREIAGNRRVIEIDPTEFTEE